VTDNLKRSTSGSKTPATFELLALSKHLIYESQTLVEPKQPEAIASQTKRLVQH
jgi:hypothetical protein